MLLFPSSSLRQRKKAATKERLYEAALTLIRRRGVAAATVDEIAAAAEVSRGTFFNYFSGKEALLRDLSARLTAASATALAAAVQAEPAGAGLSLSVRAKLGRLGQAMAAAVEADRELTRVAVFELLKSPAAIVADPYRNLLRRALGDLLREGQSRGEVAVKLDAELWSSALAGMFFQQVFDWCAAPTPYALGERLEQLLDGLWQGLAAEQPA